MPRTLVSCSRPRPCQYSSCAARERKSSRPPETAVPVLKLYYQRTTVQPAAGDGRVSTEVVLSENENPARPQPFQYYRCTTRERKSSRPPETAAPVLKLYYHTTKIQPAAENGRYPRTKIQPTVDACRGYRSSCSGSSTGNSKHQADALQTLVKDTAAHD